MANTFRMYQRTVTCKYLIYCDLFYTSPRMAKKLETAFAEAATTLEQFHTVVRKIIVVLPPWVLTRVVRKNAVTPPPSQWAKHTACCGPMGGSAYGGASDGGSRYGACSRRKPAINRKWRRLLVTRVWSPSRAIAAMSASGIPRPWASP